MQQTIAFALAVLCAGNAAAQQPARPDPADPKAVVPPQRYEPVLGNYRPYADPAIAQWRELNDEAGRLGGHAGHLPQDTRRSKPAAAKPAAQPGHEGHK